MASKLDRIEKDIQKTKSKIAEYQKQLRELEAQKTEQENFRRWRPDRVPCGSTGWRRRSFVLLQVQKAQGRYQGQRRLRRV